MIELVVIREYNVVPQHILHVHNSVLHYIIFCKVFYMINDFIVIINIKLCFKINDLYFYFNCS